MLPKLKEFNRIAICTWYPSEANALVAMGTSVGSLDVPELEITSLDTNTSSRISTHNRFRTLAWGQPSKEKVYGIIAGGTETGELELYNASSVLNGYSLDYTLLLKSKAHTGALKALDFNSFQTNLLASSGNHNEIFIWDLDHPTTPSAPGSRSSRMDDIVSIAWNGQVQHIIASASTNGYTVVWDLRSKKEIMTLAGLLSSLSSIAWHPKVATQIITASDDDQSPYLTLWDLRHAHSPERQLKGHTKGIVDLDWSKDARHLVSCGKDERILCWDPITGDILDELESTGPLCQVALSSQPNMFSVASLNGSIQVYQINQINAFRPHRLRQSIGASFGWRGRLVRFHSGQSKITLSCIKADSNLVALSDQFETALASNSLESFIEMRIQQAPEDSDWPLIQLMFSKQPREELIHYLKSNHPSSSLNKELPQKPQSMTFEKETCILQALMTGQLEAAVDACLATHRFADALMIASYGGRELMSRTQKAYLDSRVHESNALRFFSHIALQDWTFETDELTDWVQLLTAVCTYVPSHQLATVCQRLGDQWSESKDAKDSEKQVILAYMMAGDLSKVISRWIRAMHRDGWHSLVEKLTVLKRALEDDQTKLDEIYYAYAIWMIDQGLLDVAEKYLNQCRTLLN
ncbi:WD40-repeat-containing domain protein [Blakeslea trispora]|nr:WD40-repeat-containing domain protein [Blakeslea trispora]